MCSKDTVNSEMRYSYVPCKLVKYGKKIINWNNFSVEVDCI